MAPKPELPKKLATLSNEVRLAGVNPADVTSVLLVDTWHQVVPGSFEVDDNSFVLRSQDYNEWIVGFITSIAAVAVPTDE